MSKTPKLRFKEFSGDWESKCLEELFSFKNGLNKEKEFFGKGTPIVNFTDVYKNRGLKSADIKGLVEVNEKELVNYNVSKGDVFFTRTSETIDDIGMSSVILDEVENTVFSGFVLRARPKNNILSDYFKKYCFSTFNARKEIVTKSSFTTRALTSGTLLNGVEINYPSKEEQEKIASFFSLIDDKISLQIEKIEALKDYKKGMMQKIFSQEIRFKDENGENYPEWKDGKLGDVCYIQGGYAFKSSDFMKNGIPIIRISNMNNKVSINKNETVYTQIEDINDKFILNRGDLLIAMSGATTGKTGVYSLEESAYLNQRVGLFVNKNDNNLYYNFLYHIVNTYSFYKQLKSSLIAGAQPNISPDEIEIMKFKLPCLSEQKKIANFLSIIDTKIELEQEKLSSLNEYKKGLLQQMFI